MATTEDEERICAVCQETFPVRGGVAGALVRDSLAELIRREHPDWSAGSFVCEADLSKFRTRYVHSLLESEKGELTSLEHEVVRSLREHEILSSNVEAEFEQQWSLGERLADRIAAFGGSWLFLISFFAFLALWMGMNTLVLLLEPLDPYPFILLNLVLSCLAAIQAPMIMMSQKRQETKDRLRSQHDYQVNLKAELEIRQLHEKVDHVLSHQWERLVAIQEIQVELLSELAQKR